METFGKELPGSTGPAKGLRLELAELVLRGTRRLVWPEGSEGRESESGRR